MAGNAAANQSTIINRENDQQELPSREGGFMPNEMIAWASRLYELLDLFVVLTACA